MFPFQQTGRSKDHLCGCGPAGEEMLEQISVLARGTLKPKRKGFATVTILEGHPQVAECKRRLILPLAALKG
jgi:hypothetical protein